MRADLDLAVWLNDVSKIKGLKKAMNRGLALTQDTAYGGVANHQVDVHIFDIATGEYRGRQCAFGKCPKPGKRECQVPGCGAQPFLRQFPNYRFKAVLFASEPEVILFDRAANFLVPLPKIDAKRREVIVKKAPLDEDKEYGIGDDDLPF